MSARRRVAVVGSGIAGAAVGHALAEQGVEVDLFEKGPRYPYPHEAQFEEAVRLRSPRPLYERPRDLSRVALSGDYPRDLESELVCAEGGMATRWEAICLREPPSSFATRSRYGFGVDSPLAYGALEPWYGRAEALLGVSGTDADNPFAPPRSSPHPLPAFPLAWDDRLLAERLRRDGLHLHTTPQARTRAPHAGRPACRNYGACRVCPIGARFSPQHWLRRAEAAGRLRVHTGTAVRRVLLDRAGRARGLGLRPVDGGAEREHDADAVVVAAGAVESARLLLLSRTPRHPDGLGNRSGHLGRNLLFHHLWLGRLRFREALYPGRFGGWTGQSHQFLDPPGRGRHGGVKVELASRRAYATREPVQLWETPEEALAGARSAAEVEAALEPALHWRPVTFHAEAAPSGRKQLRLGEERDRFGDPVAHVHYELDDFDRETWRFCRGLFERYRRASGAVEGELAEAERYYSGFHHMGTARASAREEGGVVDPLGRVHGLPGLAVAGGAVFAGSGTVNPTLTLVALALRLGRALGEALR